MVGDPGQSAGAENNHIARHAGYDPVPHGAIKCESEHKHDGAAEPPPSVSSPTDERYTRHTDRGTDVPDDRAESAVTDAGVAPPAPVISQHVDGDVESGHRHAAPLSRAARARLAGGRVKWAQARNSRQVNAIIPIAARPPRTASMMAATRWATGHTHEGVYSHGGPQETASKRRRFAAGLWRAARTATRQYLLTTHTASRGRPGGPLQTGRIPVNVATSRLFGGCGGSWAEPTDIGGFVAGLGTELGTD